MAETPKISTTGRRHPYHIVDPSPWPLVGSLAAGLLAAGAVMYFHDAKWGEMEIGLKGVLAGLASVLFVMWVWWRDIIREAVVEKAHSPIAMIGMRFGMALFIASEVMFFAAFFWAFFDASLFPAESIGGVWPPPDIEPIPAFDLPLLMTMILLLSGCTVTWAHHAIAHGDNKQGAKALLITALLGVVFLCMQAYEYHHAAFGFGQNVYSSAFYMATGFHGFHVLVGTIFLFVCYFRTLKNHFTADSHFGFEACAWYWHFVDVVWLFLFIAVYWWGNA